MFAGGQWERKLLFLIPNQDWHGQGKVKEKLNFFNVREKWGNFAPSQGNPEFYPKVGEKSGNFISFNLPLGFIGILCCWYGTCNVVLRNILESTGVCGFNAKGFIMLGQWKVREFVLPWRVATLKLRSTTDSSQRLLTVQYTRQFKESTTLSYEQPLSLWCLLLAFNNQKLSMTDSQTRKSKLSVTNWQVL